MLVETFEVTEINCDGEAEDSGAALQLIEELELDGQAALRSGEHRFPYRRMNQEEHDVYRIILPRTTALREYGSGAIPLRVLQVAAHVKQFPEIVTHTDVWHPEDVRLDPLLVGERREGYSVKDRFILARWGEVLEPFAVLRAKAVTLYRRKYEAALRKIGAQVAATLEGLTDETCFGKAEPCFYGL